MLPEFGVFPFILFFSGEKCKYLANMCVCVSSFIDAMDKRAQWTP